MFDRRLLQNFDWILLLLLILIGVGILGYFLAATRLPFALADVVFSYEPMALVSRYGDTEFQLAVDMALGGSTNSVLHLLAFAHDTSTPQRRSSSMPSCNASGICDCTRSVRLPP